MNQTLDSLLGRKKQAGHFSTPLVERVAKACDLPLKELKWPDIRILIGQGIGLQYLMPWAINALSKRPLYCAELFDGDLLCACLSVDRSYWADNMEQWHALNSILGDLDSAVESVGGARIRFENEVFHASIETGKVTA